MELDVSVETQRPVPESAGSKKTSATPESTAKRSITPLVVLWFGVALGLLLGALSWAYITVAENYVYISDFLATSRGWISQRTRGLKLFAVGAFLTVLGILLVMTDEGGEVSANEESQIILKNSAQVGPDVVGNV